MTNRSSTFRSARNSEIARSLPLSVALPLSGALRLSGRAVLLGLGLVAGLGMAQAQETGTPAQPPVAPSADAAPSGGLRPVSSPILTLDSEELLTRSAAGQALDAELAERSAELAAENRRIEAQLSEEERDLTDRRPDMTPEDFRAEARAFDEKVQQIRTEQDAKLRALQDQSNSARRDILRAANPVLVQIMREAGAAVIMERVNVLASLETIDITALAVQRLDAAMDAEAALERIAPGGLDLGVQDVPLVTDSLPEDAMPAPVLPPSPNAPTDSPAEAPAATEGQGAD